jgi:hypothetical protein
VPVLDAYRVFVAQVVIYSSPEFGWSPQERISKIFCLAALIERVGSRRNAGYALGAYAMKERNGTGNQLTVRDGTAQQRHRRGCLQRKRFTG